MIYAGEFVWAFSPNDEFPLCSRDIASGNIPRML